MNTGGAVHSDPIKRVIDGNSYNTATATQIHETLMSENATYGPGYDHFLQLYRNRFGKFFLVERNESFWNAATGEDDLRTNVFPLDHAQAMNWMEKHCNDKIEGVVGLVEAGDPSTTLTLRMDRTLKSRLNAVASEKGVSMNVWCVHALQKAVAESR